MASSCRRILQGTGGKQRRNPQVAIIGASHQLVCSKYNLIMSKWTFGMESCCPSFLLPNLAGLINLYFGFVVYFWFLGEVFVVKPLLPSKLYGLKGTTGFSKTSLESLGKWLMEYETPLDYGA